MAEEKTFYPRNTDEWRAWLQKNHKKESKIALIKYKKHTGKPSITHQESMDEAICFGWIDTTIKRLDEDRYLRRFAKRTEKSRWSNATLGYAKRLIKEGKMTPSGLEMYKQGLKKPTLDSEVAKNPKTPEDLIVALKNNNVYDVFESWAPSYKRAYLRWIERAKLSDTRSKRIAAVVARVLQGNKKWN